MYKSLGLVLAIILIIGVYLFEFHINGQEFPLTTIAIFGFGLALWFFHVIPAPITGVVVMLLFSLFNILTFEQAVSGLGHPVVWLVISVLILGVAIEKWSLDKRIAYKVLSKYGNSENRIILIFIMIGYLFVFLIPNAMSRLALLLSIAHGVIRSAQTKNGNFNKSLILVVTLVPYLTTVTVMTGASGSIYAVGLFDATFNYQWSYLYWLILLAPISLLSLCVLWFLLKLIFPIKNSDYFDKQRFMENFQALGEMTGEEKKLVIIYSILIAGWITNEWHSISVPMFSVIAMIILFFPGMNIISWKEVRKKVDWGVPILFASGLAIALAFEEGGVIRFISMHLLAYLQDVQPFILALSVMIIMIIIRIGFTNFNSMVASTMPIVLTLGISSEVNPLWLGMIYLIASSTSFLSPIQSIGSMTTYTLGYYNSRDYFKIGFPLTVIIVILTLLAAFLYWPLLGFEVYQS